VIGPIEALDRFCRRWSDARRFLREYNERPVLQNSDLRYAVEIDAQQAVAPDPRERRFAPVLGRVNGDVGVAVG
jgi:hypothetical protein